MVEAGSPAFPMTRKEEKMNPPFVHLDVSIPFLGFLLSPKVARLAILLSSVRKRSGG
jgi:hypothetical protein